MNNIRLNFILLLSILFIGLQSCSEDEDLGSDIINTEDFRARGGNNGNPNGPNNGGPNGRNDNDQNAPNNGTSIQQQLLTQWLDLYLEIDRYAIGMRPTSTSRALAYIHLAGYETMAPSMDSYTSNSRNLNGLRIENNTRGQINYQVALNTCYADVYEHFMLNVPARFETQIEALENEFNNTLGNNVSDDVVENSQRWGASVAQQIIEYSQTDEAAESQINDPQPTSYVPPTGDGYWTFSAEPERALFPYWGSVRTFVISSEQTSSVAPIGYSTNPQSAYYTQMKEVQIANDEAKADDGEDLWIAEFWSDDVEGLMFSPPARQISIAKQLIVDNDMDIDESLYLLLKIGFALNDAAVSSWDDKYQHMVMRPSVFIQNFLDPNYQSNLYRLIPWTNPSFPAYPSGHSTFASAAGGVFIDFFGNEIDFTDRSHEGRTEFRGQPRNFDSFEEMAEENGYSRLPLGVHMEMDCAEGLRLGYEISDAINQYNVRRDVN